MRAGKKESIGVLIGAMAEAESKSFYDDTEAVTSDLKSLLNIFLKKDSSSERVQILKIMNPEHRLPEKEASARGWEPLIWNFSAGHTFHIIFPDHPRNFTGNWIIYGNKEF